MKILVLGSQGQLGRCLSDQLLYSDYNCTFSDRSTIDVTNYSHTRDKIFEIKPDVIINACAYTAVDRAEEESELANHVNNNAVFNLGRICSKINCLLIHISTDYVFDGEAKYPYKEESETNPQCVYGKTKLEGELALLKSGCKYLILRIGWIYSEYGNNFMKTMLSLAKKNKALSVVNDQVGSPTYAQDIAQTIIKILPLVKDIKEYRCIYHYSGDFTCSWYSFAELIFSKAKTYGFTTPEIVLPINTSEYPTLAKRPKYSVLDSSRLINKFNVELSNLEKGINKVLDRMNP